MTKAQDKLGHHGQTAVPDRGMRFGTPVQEVNMAGDESGHRFGRDKHIEDSLIMGKQGMNASQRKSGGHRVIDEAKKRWPQDGGSY